MDGKEDAASDASTRITCAGPGTNEWGYALIDEVPERKRKKNRNTASRHQKHVSKLLQCFSCRPDSVSDASFMHMARTATKPQGHRSSAKPKSLTNDEQVSLQHDYSSADQQPKIKVGGLQSGSRRRLSRTRTTRGARGLRAPSLASAQASRHKRPRQTSGSKKSMGEDKGPNHEENYSTNSYPEGTPLHAPPITVGDSLQGRTNERIYKGSPSIKLDHRVIRETPEQHRGVYTSNVQPVRNSMSTKPKLDADAKHPLDCMHSPPKDQAQVPAKQDSQHDTGVNTVHAPKHKRCFRPDIPGRTSSIRCGQPLDQKPSPEKTVEDVDFLRGLHVAAAAACDEVLDDFVYYKTGVRVRHVLADLLALETLGSSRPRSDLECRARKRRAQMKELKRRVRRSKVVGGMGGMRELRRRSALAA